MLLISFILQFQSVRHVTGFLRSHHIYASINLMYVKQIYLVLFNNVMTCSVHIQQRQGDEQSQGTKFELFERHMEVNVNIFILYSFGFCN